MSVRVDFIRSATLERQPMMICGDRVHFSQSGAIANVHFDQETLFQCPGCTTELVATSDTRARMELARHERVCHDLQFWLSMGE
jgi:hypothetical protein